MGCARGAVLGVPDTVERRRLRAVPMGCRVRAAHTHTLKCLSTICIQFSFSFFNFLNFNFPLYSIFSFVVPVLDLLQMIS